MHAIIKIKTTIITPPQKRKKIKHKLHHILSHCRSFWAFILHFLFSTTLQNLKGLNFFTKLYWLLNWAKHKAVLAHSSIVETLEWYLEEKAIPDIVLKAPVFSSFCQGTRCFPSPFTKLVVTISMKNGKCTDAQLLQ